LGVREEQGIQISYLAKASDEIDGRNKANSESEIEFSKLSNLTPEELEKQPRNSTISG
jgi:hypothetical protein